MSKRQLTTAGSPSPSGARGIMPYVHSTLRVDSPADHQNTAQSRHATTRTHPNNTHPPTGRHPPTHPTAHAHNTHLVWHHARQVHGVVPQHLAHGAVLGRLAVAVQLAHLRSQRGREGRAWARGRGTQRGGEVCSEQPGGHGLPCGLPPAVCWQQWPALLSRPPRPVWRCRPRAGRRAPAAGAERGAGLGSSSGAVQAGAASRGADASTAGCRQQAASRWPPTRRLKPNHPKSAPQLHIIATGSSAPCPQTAAPHTALGTGEWHHSPPAPCRPPRSPGAASRRSRGTPPPSAP